MTPSPYGADRFGPAAKPGAAVLPVEPVISIPCYEAPGTGGLPGSIDLTNHDLTRHTLIVGATGSGKTTLLRSIIRQAIGQNANRPTAKSGLLVIDFKGDSTAEFVTQCAVQAGRRRDVRVLSMNSDAAYPFFAGFKQLYDVQEYTERLLFGCGAVSQHDRFWDEAREGLLAAALTWLWLTDDQRDYGTWIQHAAAWLLSERLPGDIEPSLDRFRALAEAMQPGCPERITAEHALRTIDQYLGDLDWRTRSNLRAATSVALRALLAPDVLHLFRSQAAQSVDVGAVVNEGQILVVTINAFLSPRLGSMLAKNIRADFYREIFKRSAVGKRPPRLALFVADEYHLAASVGGVRYDDAVALPLLREFNAGVVAATQTVAGIDRAIGVANRQVLLPNFGTVFFLRTNEPVTADFAAKVCGAQPREELIRERQVFPGPGGYRQVVERTITRQVSRPVCTPEALAGLEPGQAFFHQAGQANAGGPIWIAQDGVTL